MMSHSFCDAGTVRELIDEFKKMQLLNVDAKGRSSKDRHYFGLVRSLEISMRRMMKWCEGYDARTGNKDTQKMVVGLLMAMAMLDRTRTPTSLFNNLIDRSCSDPKHGVCVCVCVCVCVHASRPTTTLLCACCVSRCLVALDNVCVLENVQGH